MNSVNRETQEFSKKKLVNERKLCREKLYSGIFEKHRQTLFVLGTFMKLFKTTSSRRKQCYEVK